MSLLLDSREVETGKARPSQTRPRAARRLPGTEALERREVPTVILGPFSYPGLDGVPLNNGVQSFIQEQGHHIKAVFNLVALPPGMTSVPVSLAIYSGADVNYPLSGANQRLYSVTSGTLDACHPCVTLCLDEPPHGCAQGDGYIGNSCDAPYQLTPDANFAFNQRLVSALVECDHIPPCDQGENACYWLNNTDQWSTPGRLYTPDVKLGAVFNNLSYPQFASFRNLTLKDALSFSSGSGLEGKTRGLLKQAVAALLNASFMDPNNFSASTIRYPIDVNAVVTAVNTALYSKDPSRIASLASQFHRFNNLGMNDCGCDGGGDGGGDDGGGDDSHHHDHNHDHDHNHGGDGGDGGDD